MGQETTGPPPEVDTRLCDGLLNLEDFATEFETQAAEFLRKPVDAIRSGMALTLSATAVSISNMVGDVLTNPDYTEGEKADLVAFILKSDDERRSNFLKKLCGSSQDNVFIDGYPEQSIASEQIGELTRQVIDPELVKDMLMEQHLVFMTADVNNFIDSDVAQKQIARRERRQKIMGATLKFGGIALATAVGVVTGVKAKESRWLK